MNKEEENNEINVIMKDSSKKIKICYKNKKHLIIDVNDCFIQFGYELDTYMQLGIFNMHFKNFPIKNNKDKAKACVFILSKIVFNREIPKYTERYIFNKKDDVEYKYGNAELPNSEELHSILKEFKNSHIQKEISYKCKYKRDVIVVCLYHFISRGYVLKECPICSEFFLTNTPKDKYCKRNNNYCSKKAHSVKTLQKRNSNPIQKYNKRIRDMLENRKDGIDIDIYREDYERVKLEYDEKQLLEWLKEKHKNYLIKKEK